MAGRDSAQCSSVLAQRNYFLLSMHTEKGDERGIRLRCICLGRAAPRGSRMRGMGRCGKGSESRIARSSLSHARSSVCAARRCLRINFTIHQKRMFWQLFLQSPNVWRRKIPSRRGQPCVKRMVVVSFEEHNLHMLAASWPAGFAVLRVGGCHIRSGWEWSRCLGAEPEGHLDATARCRRSSQPEPYERFSMLPACERAEVGPDEGG